MDEYEVRRIIKKVKEEEYGLSGCLMIVFFWVVAYIVVVLVFGKIGDDIRSLERRMQKLESQQKK